MKPITLAIALVLAAACLAQDQDAPAPTPDLSQLDADSLRTLAKNLYRRLATAEKQVRELSGELKERMIVLAAAERDRDAAIAELAALREKIADSPELKAKVSAAESIDQAIAEKRLCEGMTLDQARRAMGSEGVMQSQTESGDTYGWITDSKVQGSLREQWASRKVWTADFRDGKLTRFNMRPESERIH